jgi:hypothetical protein
MTTNERVQQFLQAEEEASRLVEELARLKEEIQHYSDASHGLDEAVGHVGSLIGEVTKATGAVGNVIKTLREIGTPELLDRLDTLEELVEISLQERIVGELKKNKKLAAFGFVTLGITQLVIVVMILAM